MSYPCHDYPDFFTFCRGCVWVPLFFVSPTAKVKTLATEYGVAKFGVSKNTSSGTPLSVTKFFAPSKITYLVERWSDTVVVSTINYASWGFVDVWNRLHEHSEGNQSIWVPGEVWSQGWNLKELTGGHHQEWSLWLNWIQHRETYQVRTQ